MIYPKLTRLTADKDLQSWETNHLSVTLPRNFSLDTLYVGFVFWMDNLGDCLNLFAKTLASRSEYLATIGQNFLTIKNITNPYLNNFLYIKSRGGK